MKRLPQRKSPRMQGYDYTQSGAYFITICTHQRQHIFGNIDNGVMTLSDAGKIARVRWLALPQHHSDIALDAFVVMPNHVHGIVIMQSEPSSSPMTNHLTSKSLGTIIGSYKSSVTRHIRKTLTKFEHEVIWQGRYHNQIIRNQRDYEPIVQYVATNPARWQEDSLRTL